MKRKIKLLIADDHAIVRQGLATILGFQPDFAVVGEAEDGQDAVEKVRTLHPDIVIMDLMMPKLNGADATAQIAAALPQTHILILTTYGSAEDISRALDAGATGALMKTASNDQLANAIRKVAAGLSATASVPFLIVTLLPWRICITWRTWWMIRIRKSICCWPLPAA